MTPNYVYTHTSHFDEGDNIVEESIHERLRELAQIFVQYCRLSETLPKQPIDKH